MSPTSCEVAARYPRHAPLLTGGSQMFDLEGKCALVTGASGGIGAAIARALHGRGATVALSGTRETLLADLAGELGERAHAIACDLFDSAAVNDLARRAEEAMGSLDILVNNAGITRDALFLRLRDGDWQAVIDVNLTAGFRIVRGALRGMMQRRWGRVIGISSVIGVTGNAGQGNYAAAKAGMIGMMKALAHEVASRNITANCVAPGFIDTAMTAELSDKQRQAILANVPAGRLGSVDDVAAAVVYLASPEASYVTGQTLHVNGGMAMI